MAENNRNVLCLFTTEFPYGNKAETFIESELEVMCNVFDEVYIVPSIYSDKIIRPIPEKIKIILLDHEWAKYKKKLLRSNFFLISKILFEEFLFSSNKKNVLIDFRKRLNSLIHKIYTAEQLKKVFEEKKLNKSILYSYWLNDWTIVLGLLKAQKYISTFISRAHGFDIYEERLLNRCIPFRYFQLKMVNQVFSVSKKGYNYLKDKKVFPEKISWSYLGVSDKGVNPFDASNVFTIISCSNLMPLKRVHLIVDVLKNINFPVKWVHFGDGSLFNDLKEQSSYLPHNINVEFKGHVNNQDVLSYYQMHSVNLFVLFSESEGLPMSLIEACSFGIPLMATDVGGVSEIVNSSTGILIPKEFKPKNVAIQIAEFKEGEMNKKEFRSQVKNFWLENFHDMTNYRKFYKTIIEKNNK